MATAKNSLEGKAKPYMERIEHLFADLESEKGSYMARCKEIREDIREIYTEAKNNDVPPKALRGLVKFRELERRQADIADGMDIDESAAYSHLVEALGPLGRAAAKAAGVEVDDDKDVRPPHLKAKTEGRADEAALDKVGQGAAVDSLTH